MCLVNTETIIEGNCQVMMRHCYQKLFHGPGTVAAGVLANRGLSNSTPRQVINGFQHIALGEAVLLMEKDARVKALQGKKPPC